MATSTVTVISDVNIRITLKTAKIETPSVAENSSKKELNCSKSKNLHEYSKVYPIPYSFSIYLKSLRNWIPLDALGILL